MKNIKEYLPLISKIIDWAHKHKKKVQYLTKADLREAIRSRA
jgi:hypothetical protein